MQPVAMTARITSTLIFETLRIALTKLSLVKMVHLAAQRDASATVDRSTVLSRKVKVKQWHVRSEQTLTESLLNIATLL